MVKGENIIKVGNSTPLFLLLFLLPFRLLRVFLILQPKTNIQLMNNISHYFIRYGIGMFFCFCFSFSLPAQEIIDSAQYRAIYNFSYKTNPNQTDFSKTDLMYLDVGNQTSIFYSKYEQIRDSIKKEGIKKGLSAFETVENLRNYKRGLSNFVYTLYDQKKRITTDVFFKKYFYDEALTLPKWHILENDKKEISGYLCQKAITNYLGRDWIVYFTPEIPYSYGPWKLWGLPGLIIKANDKEDLFLFDIASFEHLREMKKIEYIYNNDNSFTKLSKNNFTKWEKLFYQDRHEFQRLTLPGTTIHMTKEQTERYQKQKEQGGTSHIPLEPW